MKPKQAAASIDALAGLFPAVFVADPRQPHRALKIGIRDDLLARGVTKRHGKALVYYVRRERYQEALIGGGQGIDLDGNECGVIAPDDVEQAKARLVDIRQRIEAARQRRLDEVRKARAADVLKDFNELRAKRLRRAARPAMPSGKPLGLDGLRAAARARKAALP